MQETITAEFFGNQTFNITRQDKLQSCLYNGVVGIPKAFVSVEAQPVCVDLIWLTLGLCLLCGLIWCRWVLWGSACYVGWSDVGEFYGDLPVVWVDLMPLGFMGLCLLCGLIWCRWVLWGSSCCVGWCDATGFYGDLPVVWVGLMLLGFMGLCLLWGLIWHCWVLWGFVCCVG